jgi:hypothetical protein
VQEWYCVYMVLSYTLVRGALTAPESGT